MNQNIIIINGPNLNLLGSREPEIYGNQTFEEFYKILKVEYKNIALSYYQTNHEGNIIDKLHEVGFSYDAIILNAGGYTHTSIAIADAIKGITTPVAEVHISDIYAREKYRHHSYIKPMAVISIVGKGLKGYKEAINYFQNY
ncbi:MAG: type II 3-dehydroquinate dehydratase [Saprospiraceae bacterium]